MTSLISRIIAQLVPPPGFPGPFRFSNHVTVDTRQPNASPAARNERAQLSTYRVVPQSAVLGFIQNQFNHPLLKQACIEPRNTIGRACASLARHDLIVHDVRDNTSPDVEVFYSWKGVLSLRRRHPPILNDGGLVHETLHLSTLANTYDPHASPDDVAHKLMLNEKATSLYTDAILFFEFPELRSAFTGEGSIAEAESWGDQFLANAVQLDPGFSDNRTLFETNRELFLRRLVARNLWEETQDYAPLPWASRRELIFNRTNRIYGLQWRDGFQEVESRMAQYVANRMVDGAKAVAQHLSWLDANTRDDILFLQRAQAYSRAFRGVYESALYADRVDSYLHVPMTSGVDVDEYTREVLSFMGKSS